MSPTSNFTYDTKKYFVLNTAYILTGKSLKYLTAVINSKVLDFYFPMISTDVQGQTRRYIKQYVELLPVPQIASQSQLPFETLVDCILFCKERNLEQEARFFESVIDGMVYELYFPGEIKAAGCEVLKHIAKLPEFKNDWSDEKKLAVIEKIYKELSDPKHPVNVAMVKMQEIPEVKLIEGKE